MTAVESWPVPDPRHLRRGVVVTSEDLRRPLVLDLDEGDRSAWVIDVPCRLENGELRTLQVRRGPREHTERFGQAKTYNEIVAQGLRNVEVIVPRDVSVHDILAVRAGAVVPWERARALGLVPA